MQRRGTNIEKSEIYFCTAAIRRWQHLMEEDEFKDIIIKSLQTLTDRGKISVFAFIIMPNHVHLLWRYHDPNDKDSSPDFFLDHTARVFKKKLQKSNSEKLALYKINSSGTGFEFWQGDSLTIPIFTRNAALEKLFYIHNNPLVEHWQLAKHASEYKYSSAKYYALREKNFPFLKDLWDEI